MQTVNGPAHRLLRIVLHIAHIGLDHLEALLVDQCTDGLAPRHAGGDLRLEIGDVLDRVAGGPVAAGQQKAGLRLRKTALFDQQDIVDQHALFLHGAAHRGHGARGDPADIPVMASGCDEGDQRPLLPEHGGDHGDVRQVCTAVVGGVQHVDVAGLEPPPVRRPRRRHRPHAVPHGAEVHGHVRRVGDQVRLPVEQGAGEVEPLLDIDRVGGVLQRLAHLLGHGHEEVVEELEPDRIAADVPCEARRGGEVGEDQRPLRIDRRGPARLHHRRAGGLGHDGGTGEAHAGGQRLAGIDGRIEGLALEAGLDEPGGRRGVRGCARLAGFQ